MTQTEFTQRVLAMQDRLYRVSCTLRIRESAVKSRLHRGREKLRQSDELKELLEDE